MIDGALRDLCRAVAEEFLLNRGWTLAFEWSGDRQRVAGDFLDGVVRSVAPRWQDGARLDRQKELIRKGVLNQYSRLLYRACLRPGSTRAEIAYTELWNHLYDVAYHELRGDEAAAQDQAQKALISLFARFDQAPAGFMQDEGAFLGYARITLLREVWRYLKEQRTMVELEGDDHAGREEQEMNEVSDSGQRADGPVVRRATRREVEAAIATCLRSLQQRQVIVGLFLRGLTVLELAEALDCTPENVYVLKSRAMDRLRRCPGLYEALIRALQDSGGKQGGYRGGSAR
jgi:RNA polymerase sigma factor (sigma-70 family)